MLADQLVEIIMVSSIVAMFAAFAVGIVLSLKTRAPKWFLRGIAGSSLALAVLGTNAGLNPDFRTPEESELSQTSGQLAFQDRGENILRFRLSGSDVRFSYSSKSGQSGVVWDRVVEGENIVFVHTPDQDGRAKIYGVSVDGVEVRTYAQVVSSRRGDNRIGWGLAAMGLVCFLVIWTHSNKPEFSGPSKGQSEDDDQ